MRITMMAALGALTAAAPIALAQEGAGSGPGEGSRACPVLASSQWSAWINAEPGPGATPTLIVQGEADLPTPGYAASWTIGPADRRLPPAQYIDLRFTPPDGMVAQVVTVEKLRFETPAVYPEYRAIIIRCGDKTLATISPVPIAR